MGQSLRPPAAVAAVRAGRQSRLPFSQEKQAPSKPKPVSIFERQNLLCAEIILGQAQQSNGASEGLAVEWARMIVARQKGRT